MVESGSRKPLDRARLQRLVESACEGLADAAPQAILEATLRDLYDGVPMQEVRKSSVLAARALIEKDPAYSFVTARLLLDTIRLEVLGEEASQADMETRYAAYFPQFIARGVEAELLDPELAKFDLARLGKALKAGRDLQFGYLGLQTLYDRYFLHMRRPAHRAAAGVLHARGDGAGAAAKKTGKPAPSSSTTCSRASTS